MALIAAGLAGIGASLGYYVSYVVNSPLPLISLWQREIASIQEELDRLSWRTEARVELLASELGRLHYEVSKLDTVTVKLSSAASINLRDFIKERESNYPKAVAAAFKGRKGDTSVTIVDIASLFGALESSIESKSQELHYLYSVLLQKKLTQSTTPKGFPIRNGYITSYYGNRVHPISRKIEFHHGVDIGTPVPDSDVYATASGIITRSSHASGYGYMIEIDHGNQLRTRYAHNEINYVPKGAVVYRGQPIARLGNTGESTGPHVHYEVIQSLKPINPMPYLY